MADDDNRLTYMSVQHFDDARNHAVNHRLLCFTFWRVSHPRATFPFLQCVRILPGEISTRAIFPLTKIHLAQRRACPYLNFQGAGNRCSSLLSPLLWTAIKGVHVLSPQSLGQALRLGTTNRCERYLGDTTESIITTGMRLSMSHKQQMCSHCWHQVHSRFLKRVT